MANNGNEKDILTSAQRRAIAALLTERDIKSAAKAAGVGERTLHRWIREDALFNLSLHEAEANALEAITRQLIRLGGDATQVIEDTMSGEASAGVKLRAADILLSNMLRIRELVSLESRLAALESAENRNENKP